MSWTGRHQKDYVFLEVEIAALDEYLQKVEGGILHRKKVMTKDIYFTTLVRWRFNLYSFSSLVDCNIHFRSALCLRHQTKLSRCFVTMRDWKEHAVSLESFAQLKHKRNKQFVVWFCDLDSLKSESFVC